MNNCGESLTELRLKQVGLMDDSFIYELVGLGEYQKLALLDLSEPSLPCSGEALGELLAAVGGQLRVLDLSKHGHLDDDFLKEGISPNVRGLERLSLSHMFDLTDDGVAEFFFHWRNEPLIEICLARNHACGSKALAALLRHSGRTLEVLNINGWKDVTDSALKLVGRHGKRMREMDVSWCREMDDFVMKMWLEGDPEHEGWDGCPRLGLVKVWGCNKISSACPRRVSVLAPELFVDCDDFWADFSMPFLFCFVLARYDHLRGRIACRYMRIFLVLQYLISTYS